MDLGYTEMEFKNFKFKISDPARAMMECLFLVPNRQSLIECYEIMEGLNSLRPTHVQALLEHCNSVKVKRSIVKGGVYDPKYQITVDKELESVG